MQILKADLEVKVRIGPFVDVGDGFTPEAAVTLAGGGDNADEAELLKHNGAATTDISGNGWAAIAGCDGWYDLTVTAGNLDTEGLLDIIIQNDSVHLPVHARFMVMNADAYSFLYGAAGNNATLRLKQLDIQNSAGSAVVMGATGGNGHGLQISGNGTGEGISSTGGLTGHGIEAIGGGTSGDGIKATATDGDGIDSSAGGNNHGMRLVGSGTGEGFNSSGASDGQGGSINLAVDTTLAVRTSDSVFTINAGSGTNAYGNMVCAIYDVSGNDWECRKISTYAGATKTVTVDTAFSFTVAANDIVRIFHSSYVLSGTGATAAQIWGTDLSTYNTTNTAGLLQKAGGRYA
jgi:hypothetical protein